MISWLEKIDIEMYSTQNQGKSLVAERFIRTLNNNIYKYMTSTSKNVYIDKLDDIVNKHNNAYIAQLKWKSIQVHMLTLVKKLIIKLLNLKLMILLEHQNITTFF